MMGVTGGISPSWGLFVRMKCTLGRECLSEGHQEVPGICDYSVGSHRLSWTRTASLAQSSKTWWSMIKAGKSSTCSGWEAEDRGDDVHEESQQLAMKTRTRLVTSCFPLSHSLQNPQKKKLSTVIQIRDRNSEISFSLMDMTDLDFLGHLQNTVILNFSQSVVAWPAKLSV